MNILDMRAVWIPRSSYVGVNERQRLVTHWRSPLIKLLYIQLKERTRVKITIMPYKGQGNNTTMYKLELHGQRKTVDTREKEYELKKRR